MLKRSFIAVFAACLFIFACSHSFAQKKESRDPSKRPKDFLTPTTSASYMKTKEYREAREKLERDFWWLYEADEKKRILSQSKESLLRALETDKDFWKVAKARYWCIKNAPEVIPDLIRLVENPKVVGLEGYFDLIIWERVQSKDLPFYGHGWVVPDDLFSVAGRASWILREITGQQFNAVSMKSTPEELKQLSATWLTWYEKNK
jgi:hypothetical protein